MTIYKTRTRTVVEEHEVTKEDLDEALFVMLNPTFDSNWTDVKIQEAIELVRLAYKNGYRLREADKESRCNNCQNNTDELSGECYECVKGIEDWYEPIEENKE